MFTVTKEVLENCEALLTVEFEEAQVQEAMRKAARKISNDMHFPGFRKGKVPYHVVVRQVGEEFVRREAAELLLDTTYVEILKQAEVEPVAAGSLEDLALMPLQLKIRVPLMPVVTLQEYADLRLTPEAVEVSEREVGQVLERVREGYALKQPVERPAALGDEVLLAHIEGRVNGQVFLHEHDVPLVLDPEEPRLIPGLVEALVGLSAGEEKLFHLTLPEDFGDPALNNAEAEFEVHVESVAERTLPALDDALASTVGNFETLEDLRANVRSSLYNRKQEAADEAYDDALIKALVARADVRYPPIMLEDEIDDEIMVFRSRVQTEQDMAWEDFLRLQGLQEEQLREILRPRAIEHLTERLVIEEFARREGITVDEQELRTAYETLLSHLDVPSRKKQPFSMNLPLVQNIRRSMLRPRVLAALKRLAQGLPEVPPAEEMVSAAEV